MHIGSPDLVRFLLNTATLKKGTKTSSFQSNELYVIQSLYNYPFHKTLYTLGITFDPCPWALWACVHANDIVI